MKKYKVGIVLSGGGARGIAHLGVLQALHENGIEPDAIAGTSMGAIVGCFYAAGCSPAFILEEIKKERITKFLSFSLPGDGFLDLEHIEELMKKHIGVNNFKSLKKPFFISVSNLNTGKYEIISQGRLFEYVIASASIPIIFKPQVINNNTYVDGGLLNNLPAQALRNDCEKLICVHVNHSGPLKKISGLKEIVERCLRLGIESNIIESIKAADVIIQPEKIKEYNTFDFRKSEEIYRAGYEATLEMMEEIKKKIETN